jgi:hypothetical protein
VEIAVCLKVSLRVRVVSGDVSPVPGSTLSLNIERAEVRSN